MLHMPLLAEQTLIAITKVGRKKLKRLATELGRPMYQVLEELIDAAAQELTYDEPATTARQATQRLVLDRE